MIATCDGPRDVPMAPAPTVSMTAYWTGHDGTVYHADSPAEMRETAPLTAAEDAAVLIWDRRARGSTDGVYTGTIATVADEWQRQLDAGLR